jgi:AmiR/NasT family two-component response regulator
MIEHETAVERLLAVTEASYERRAQLQIALDSRVAIEQAKGILAERHSLELEETFEVLRRAARSNRMKIHELASRVRPGRETPAEIAILLDV